MDDHAWQSDNGMKQNNRHSPSTEAVKRSHLYQSAYNQQELVKRN